jgi:hypothetical protein
MGVVGDRGSRFYSFKTLLVFSNQSVCDGEQAVRRCQVARSINYISDVATTHRCEEFASRLTEKIRVAAIP